MMLIAYYSNWELTTSDVLTILLGICLILGVVYHIFKLLRPFYYMITENGFIYPKQTPGSDNKIRRVGFDEINSISFYNYGLAAHLTLENGTIFNISNSEGEKPYVILVKRIIQSLNLTEYPDLSVLENWDSYKTKIERQKAFMSHIYKNTKYSNLPKKD
jgi:hypothetical protein